MFLLSKILPALLITANAGSTIMMSHNCDGVLQFFPQSGNGISIEGKMYSRVYEAIFSRIFARATAMCPGLTQSDFDLLYDPMTAIFNIASATTTYPSPPANCKNLFGRNLTAFGNLLDIGLPSTCAFNAWRTSGTCNLKMTLPGFETVPFGISSWKCPNSYLTGFAFSCLGDGCGKLFAPCNSNSDCAGGLSCFDVGKTVELNPVDLQNNITSFLKSIFLEDPGRTCFQTVNGNPSNDFFSSILTFLGQNFYSSEGTFNQLKFCGADNIYNTIMNPNALATSFSIQTSQNTMYCNAKMSKIVVTSTTLGEWDGKLPDGVSIKSKMVNTPIRQSSYDKTSWLKSWCDKFGLQFDLPFFKVITEEGIAKTMDFFSNLIFKTQECRDALKPLSREQFLVRFGFWQLSPFLFQLDPTAYSFDLGPKFNDWNFAIFNSGSKIQVNLPSTCNFNKWQSKKTCTMNYSGFNSLTKMNITMSSSVQECPNSMFFNVSLGCTGNDCENLLQPKFCTSSSDCKSQQVCASEFDSIISTDYIGTQVFGDLNFCSFDMSTTGGDLNQFKREVAFIIDRAFNPSAAYSDVDRKLSFCTLDFSRITDEQIQLWSQNAATAVKNIYTVAGLNDGLSDSRLALSNYNDCLDAKSSFSGLSCSVDMSALNSDLNLTALNSDGFQIFPELLSYFLPILGTLLSFKLIL
jgi:hypothetical protein